MRICLQSNLRSLPPSAGLFCPNSIQTPPLPAPPARSHAQVFKHASCFAQRCTVGMRLQCTLAGVLIQFLHARRSPGAAVNCAVHGMPVKCELLHAEHNLEELIAKQLQQVMEKLFPRRKAAYASMQLEDADGGQGSCLSLSLKCCAGSPMLFSSCCCLLLTRPASN